jgi:hypothetical protein
MSNRVCISCNKTFKYPYLLKRHRDGVYGCEVVNDVETLQANSRVDNINSNISVNNNINIIEVKNQCIKCKQIFKHRQSLCRHKKLCNRQQTNISTEQQIPLQQILLPLQQQLQLIPQLIIQQQQQLLQLQQMQQQQQIQIQQNSLTRNARKVRKSQNEQQAPIQQAPIQQAPVQQAPVQQAPIQQAPIQQAPIQQAPIQQAPIQQAPVQQAPVQQVLQQAQVINNITNNLEINNDINNNEVVNNYITHFHINPFGLENSNFLTNDQKLNILHSGHLAGVKILTLVYNKRENKNFFKTNKKNTHITFIDKDYELNILEEHAFKKKLYANGTNLLYSIFLESLPNLSIEQRINISDNINYIENDMYKEIFNNSLSNVKKEMNGELNQIIKKQTELNNSSIKIFANNFIDNIIKNPNNLKLAKTEVIKKQRKNKIINMQINGINEDIYSIVTPNTCNLALLAENLCMNFYDDTDFYKNLIIMEKKEEELLKKFNSIGLYKKYSEIKQNRKKKIEEIKNVETDKDKLKSYIKNGELID